MRKSICLLLFVLLYVNSLSAQINYGPSLWAKIDTGIANKNNLTDVRKNLEEIKQQAIDSNKPVTIARCFYYQMLIDDLRSEDTLFFKNSAFIDSVLQTHPLPETQAIMHLMQANRLSAFSNRFFYHGNKNLFRNKRGGIDYASLDTHQLDSLITLHFDAARQNAPSLAAFPAYELMWLYGQPLSFLFNPSFIDLVFANQLYYLQKKEYNNPQLLKKDWLLLSPNSFMNSVDSLVTVSKKGSPVLSTYQRWAKIYQQASPEAFYIIESMARKYFVGDNPDSLRQRQYGRYLLQLVQSPYTGAKANGVYQLCLLWHKMGLEFNPAAAKSFDKYSYYYGNHTTDSSYRFYFTKALQLFEQHEAMLDSFAVFKNILQGMRQQIKASQLSLQVNSNPLPNEPIPALVKFKNVAQVYTTVVRLSAAFEFPRYEGNNGKALYVLTEAVGKDTGMKVIQKTNHERTLEYLLQQPSVANQTFTIPPQNDYQYHQSYIKIDSLPAGRYALLFSGQPLTDSNSAISDYIELQITNIAVINNDERVFVLHRKTGFPLQTATLVASKYVERKTDDTVGNIMVETKPQKANAEGYVWVTGKNIKKVKVMDGADTLITTINQTDDDHISDEVYDEDDDDILGYYEDNTTLHLFTDRAIYRAGQTVYFKGIYITRNPATGENLVLNWKNFKVGFFNKIIYKLAYKFGHQKLWMDLTDPFSRIVDSIAIKPNKYGSVAGSFVIPKNAPTGEWSLEVDDTETDADLFAETDYRTNNGNFKVEEYKRPSFECTIEKPKLPLKLGDSFNVKVKLRSFAGAQLGHTLVKYDVERSGGLPIKDTLNEDIKDQFFSETIKAGKGEGYTNEKGEFDIMVVDTLLRKYPNTSNGRYSANYEITVVAIDATGETHEAETNISLSNRPIIINIPLPAIIEKTSLKPIYISTKHSLAGLVEKPVEIKIYKLESKKETETKRGWEDQPDVWLYNQQQWQQWFPDLISQPASKANPQLVFDTTILAGGKDKFTIPATLPAGNYKLEASCKENGWLVGESSKTFALFDKAGGSFPQPGPTFHYLPFNSIKNGGQIHWFTGNDRHDIFSIYQIAYYSKGKKTSGQKYLYDIKPEKKGLNEWVIAMPQDAEDRVSITHLYITNNQLYKTTEQVYVDAAQSQQPKIIVSQYRSSLAPGESGQLTVSVKTKSENTAAELMTVLYDASLDKLEKHNWELPRIRQNERINLHWDNDINSPATKAIQTNETLVHKQASGQAPLWWINPLNMQYGTTMGDWNAGVNTLNGMASGLYIANGLDEVVVSAVSMGYYNVKAQTGSGSSITIRGVASLTSSSEALIIIDGIIFSGDLSKVDPASITAVEVLKDAAATAMYGSLAANGVILISTKGPVIMPDVPEPPPVVIRKNFNETAFFYPQIHAGRDGYYDINFTMPQSVTEWKWKMLAHTKKAQFAYLEKIILTQLPLLVQPNVPRFLSQGDRLVLKTRISNLDTNKVSGYAACVVEDYETGEDITSRIVKVAQKDFSTAAKANAYASFEFNIPENMLHPLRIKITATAGGFSDGEEHIIPILSKQILVSKQVKFTLDNKSDTTIQTPALPADAKPYGITLSITAQPQAAMLHALPSLAFYPYGCAEQTFNKMYAYSVATAIMRNDTAAQQAMQRLLNKDKNIDAKQPDELDESTMPWLQLNHANTVHQKQLAMLLDTLKGHAAMEKHFDELLGMQNSDGGITWFKGGKSDGYISTYILGAFGKLKKEGLPFLFNAKMIDNYNAFITKLIDYTDKQMLQPWNMSGTESLSYLYARSFWYQKFKPSVALQHWQDSTLVAAWKNVNSLSLGRQAMLITASLRNGEVFGPQAVAQLQSIAQLAIIDDKGMRWKDISNADDFNAQDEETLVILADAFDESDKAKEVYAIAIIRWLLKAKQEHGWSNTKATAAVVRLLHHYTFTAGDFSILVALLSKGIITVNNGLFDGSLFNFLPLDSFTKAIDVKEAVQGTLVQKTSRPDYMPALKKAPLSGSLGYYYFTAHPPISDNDGTAKLTKQLYRFNTASNTWNAITDTTVLHIADKLKTVITIDAAKQLRYVFIDEHRAAALEPADASSGYEWSQGFSYYKQVRDAGFQFFAEGIPSGISSISYETVVAKEGYFYNGTCALQCMYQPAVKAYSIGFGMLVTE